MIYGFLATNHSERTIGCWGVLMDGSNKNGSIDEGGIAASSSSEKHQAKGKETSWKEEFKMMSQWNSLPDGEFEKSFKANYKAPISMTVQQKNDMVPTSLHPYMQSMYKAHQNVLDLCREQVSRQSH